jgi:glycosyltransferase involved in cell wall biosynthesis
MVQAPIRLLLITSSYPATSSDSRGSFIELLARNLLQQGVRLTVLAPGTPGAPTKESIAGVQIERVRYWIDRYQGLATGTAGIAPTLRHKPWLAAQVPTLVTALTMAARRLAREVDLIHAHWVYPSGLAGMLAARSAGIPLVVTSHGGDLNLARRVPPLHWLASWVSRRADMCIGVSHAVVEAFRNIGVPSTRVRYVPLGVELGHFRPDADTPSSRPMRIIYVGRLIPLKSVETLILALEELQLRNCAVECWIVGSGPRQNSLQQLSASLGIQRITFLGEQPHYKIPSLIGSADVLVLPSLTEGRGVVIMEAMAVGVTVVVSNIPGARELVQHGKTGLLFEVGKPDSLADQLETLARDPTTRKLYGKRGRSHLEAEGLTDQMSASAHVELYRDVLRGGARRGSDLEHSLRSNSRD